MALDASNAKRWRWLHPVPRDGAGSIQCPEIGLVATSGKVVESDGSEPGGQVTVDKVERLQVAHPGGDLTGDEDQTAHGEAVIGGHAALVHQQLLLVELAVALEELVQVAKVQVLEHHAERLRGRADTQHSRQVSVVERRQQPHLGVESRPAASTSPKNERVSSGDAIYGPSRLLLSRCSLSLSLSLSSSSVLSIPIAGWDPDNGIH